MPAVTTCQEVPSHRCTAVAVVTSTRPTATISVGAVPGPPSLSMPSTFLLNCGEGASSTFAEVMAEALTGGKGERITGPSPPQYRLSLMIVVVKIAPDVNPNVPYASFSS